MLEQYTKELFRKSVADCTEEELYNAALSSCSARQADLPDVKGEKKLYYISAEFLIGKLLSNNLLNLGIYDTVQAELSAVGKSIAELESIEPEPSLGNGGLGRLAACFLDSIATLGLHGDGVGLCYHNGLFRQCLQGGKQEELPNPWISNPSWLHDTGKKYMVSFDFGTVQAKLFDIDVPGYGGNVKNKLHLFDLDTDSLTPIQNGIDFDKTDLAHNLTLFLYPDDSDHKGKMLRIYQQYFMVSCAAQFILDELVARGHSLRELAGYTAIQINDTHPSMIIPELVQRLTAAGIPFDEAADIVTRTCAYTNHTILAEALEKWPIEDLRQAVPHLVPVIEQLDAKAKAAHPLPALAIIDDIGRVHMARLDMHYSHSVNGVAALHTEILKNSELKVFADVYPEKFNNKTNGITFRRWLMACNPALSQWITGRIGDAWKQDADQLRALLPLTNDAAALEEFCQIKQQAKSNLATYLHETQSVSINPDSILDVQIKRLHEYKRQQMNLLYIIWKIQQIHAGNLPPRPVTFLLAAKAAPAYTLAKDIIHALLCLADVIDRDPALSQYLKVVFVENYNVTNAEHIVPAADVSEQISLASKEASGTGNMKLMLNGAVTLGTLDGANVEIAQLVGPENIYLFGKQSDEVIALYENHSYNANALYHTAEIEPIVDFLLSKPMLAVGDAENLGRLYQDLTHKDWFMALLDLQDYITVKEKMFADYENRTAWAQKALVNIAHAGYFSSDRTIAEYNRDIWHL